MKIRRVNQLDITYSKRYQYSVVSPDKKRLGTFATEEEAVAYAKTIRDYMKVQKMPKIHYTIDELCGLANKHYGLISGSIGSIEYYHDMTINAIVQVCNEYGGVQVLLHGTDTELKKYLKGLLDGTILLKMR